MPNCHVPRVRILQGWPLGHFAERYTRRFLNLTDAEYERVKLQPFCAAGMQGGRCRVGGARIGGR